MRTHASTRRRKDGCSRRRVVAHHTSCSQRRSKARARQPTTTPPRQGPRREESASREGRVGQGGTRTLGLLLEALAHEEVLGERLLGQVKRVVDDTETGRSLSTEGDLETPQEHALGIRHLRSAAPLSNLLPRHRLHAVPALPLPTSIQPPQAAPGHVPAHAPAMRLRTGTSGLEQHLQQWTGRQAGTAQQDEGMNG